MAEAWVKKYLRMRPEVEQIFDDLDMFQQFCKNYGYVYDESHLYNERTPAFNEFVKFSKGREPWDQWRTPKRREPRPEYSRSRY